MRLSLLRLFDPRGGMRVYNKKQVKEIEKIMDERSGMPMIVLLLVTGTAFALYSRYKTEKEIIEAPFKK